MQIEMVMGRVHKLFDNRRKALNYVDAFYPQDIPGISEVELKSGERNFLIEVEKPVALISDVEYSVLTVEDPKEIT